MAVGVVWMVSGIVSFFSFDAVAFYQAMGYPDELARSMGPMLASMRWALILYTPIWLAFLVWVRRYLGTPAPALEQAV